MQYAPTINMTEQKQPTKTCNFKGVTCPYNYVKTKLALEMLPLGEVLEVIVDEGEPSREVPRSVIEDGQSVIQTFTDEDGLVHIIIEKRKEY